MFSRLSSLILSVFGWQTVYVAPPGQKSVIMLYPHTSNWDFPLGVLFRAKYDLDIKWAGKDTLFRGPLKSLFIRLGGVPINRRERTGMIAQLSEEFAINESFHICLAPEGTRSKTDHWKTGFYRLAMAAQVPVGLGFVDYEKKNVGIERWVTLSGNESADLELFSDYYANKRARYPGKAGEIRFRD